MRPAALGAGGRGAGGAGGGPPASARGALPPAQERRQPSIIQGATGAPCAIPERVHERLLNGTTGLPDLGEVHPLAHRWLPDLLLLWYLEQFSKED